MNQEMETALRSVASQDPASWSSQLLWVEFTHNTLPSSATGLSPFQCAYGFQPPLFSVEEKEVTCPSVQSKSDAAVRLGTELGPPSSVQLTATPQLLIDGEPKRLCIRWVRRCGCQLRTYRYGWNPRN
ncbi:hypothetical protein LDENG_00020350 [Lucifuga dentata]|nr:hypothetical protein LDENG_00020350 [Lucifuga dentata]